MCPSLMPPAGRPVGWSVGRCTRIYAAEPSYSPPTSPSISEVPRDCMRWPTTGRGMAYGIASCIYRRSLARHRTHEYTTERGRGSALKGMAPINRAAGGYACRGAFMASCASHASSDLRRATGRRKLQAGRSGSSSTRPECVPARACWCRACRGEGTG